MTDKILVITNPIAGGVSKDGFINNVLPTLKSAGLDYDLVFTERAHHAAELAAAAPDGCTVVAVGGDGTVNEVASQLRGTSKTLGIIPFGSGNGLARHLGLSMNPAKALEVVKAGKTTTIDSATLNGHPFFCTCGVGLDADVDVRYTNAGTRGLKTYVKCSVVAWHKNKPCHYSLDIDGLKLEVKATMITIGNANQWGNNVFITPQASLEDGLLDVAVVDPLWLHDIPIQAGLALIKELNISHKVHYFRGKHITIQREQQGPAHYDGEPLVLGTEINVDIAEKSLKVLIP